MQAHRDRAQLLLVDVQQMLVPHVTDHVRIVANCARLIGYARCMGVPITVSEHVPGSIGPTISELAELLGNASRLEKVECSCWRNPGLQGRLSQLRREGRRQVVVAGMEAHVCVGQTVLDLIAHEFDVFLVADAVGSRSPEVRELALRRLEQAGAALVSHEMVAFEWLGRADVPEFRDVLRLLK